MLSYVVSSKKFNCLHLKFVIVDTHGCVKKLFSLNIGVRIMWEYNY